MSAKNNEFNNTREHKGFIQKLAKHKWRNGIIIFFLSIIILIVITMVVTNDPSPVGHFRSHEGELAYKEAYDEAMKLLPKPSKAIDIDTDFGSVRVYEFKNESNSSATPVILLPGRSSGVPMWSENLPDYAAEHTVYALDALGDAGLSVQTAKINDAADQAVWLEQVFEQLGLTSLHLVGHSFGGWSAANYAVHYPERVTTLTLIEPVFVFTGLRWQIYIKSVPASIPILPQSWRDKMLADIGGTSEIDTNDPMTRMISEATKHYSLVLPLPEQVKAEQLTMPVYAALAENSTIHNSHEAYKNAISAVKTIQAKIWEDASHSLPMEFPKQLDHEVLDFMKNYE